MSAGQSIKEKSIPIQVGSQQSHSISQLSSLDLSASEPPSTTQSPLKNESQASSAVTHLKIDELQNFAYNKHEYSQSNLLDSSIQARNELDLKHLHSPSAHIEEIPPYPVGKSSSLLISESSRQIILHAQLIDLQRRCTTLVGIIHRLAKTYNIPFSILHSVDSDDDAGLSSLEEGSATNQRQSELSDSQSYQEQIENYQSLQNFVQGYKAELRKYQDKVNVLQSAAKLKIEELNSELQKMRIQLGTKQQQIASHKKQNEQMVRKNEELLLQIEKMSEVKLNQIYKSPLKRAVPSQCNQYNWQRFCSSPNTSPKFNLPVGMNSVGSQEMERMDSSIMSKYSRMESNPYMGSSEPHEERSFTMLDYQECIKEMEKIIDKLASSLQEEKKSKHKLVVQIERLFQCVQSSECQIQVKNNQIYQLQKQLISREAATLEKSKSLQSKPPKFKVWEKTPQKSGWNHGNKQRTELGKDYGQYYSARWENSRRKIASEAGKTANFYQLNRPRPSISKGYQEYNGDYI